MPRIQAAKIVLHRVATGDVIFLEFDRDTGSLDACPLDVQLVVVTDAQSPVRERTAASRVRHRDEGQDEPRIPGLELRMVRMQSCGSLPEERGVEVDRALDVAHVEGQVHTEGVRCRAHRGFSPVRPPLDGACGAGMHPKRQKPACSRAL